MVDECKKWPKSVFLIASPHPIPLFGTDENGKATSANHPWQPKGKEQGYILRYITFTHAIPKLNIVKERRRIVLTTMIKIRKGDMPVTGIFLQIMI